MNVKELKELFNWVSPTVIHHIELRKLSGEKKVKNYLEQGKFPYTISAWENFLEDSTFNKCELAEIGVELFKDDDNLHTLRIFLE